jgi:hypothetical protein
MRCAASYAFIAISSVVLPIRGWGQVQIPKASDGYAITKNDVSQAAPAGYEGRTENSTQTAVGNTSATAGKRYVTHFTLTGELRADGSRNSDRSSTRCSARKRRDRECTRGERAHGSSAHGACAHEGWRAFANGGRAGLDRVTRALD